MYIDLWCACYCSTVVHSGHFLHKSSLHSTIDHYRPRNSLHSNSTYFSSRE